MRAFAAFVLVILLVIKFKASYEKQLFVEKRFYHKKRNFTGLKKRKPIVIIPGILGSQLQARFDQFYSVKHCYRHYDWFTIWLNPIEISEFSCWIENMKVVYNNSTGSYSNIPGVHFRVSGFGSTRTIENLLVHNLYSLGKYFAPVVEFLVNFGGYTRGKNVLGAPYDWRFSLKQNSKYFKKLRFLIEMAYQNAGRKVVLLAHSMGCPYTNYFLNKQSSRWKVKYIDSFVSISGGYFGSVKSLKAIISGDAEGFEIFLDQFKIRKMLRTLPSFMYMFPRPEYWPEEKSTVVTTSKRNYTVGDYQSLMKDINCESCLDLWKDNALNASDFGPPGVLVHCMFSTGVPTIERLVYTGNFSHSTPQKIYGDGDGTISTFSASACLKWKKQQSEPVYRHRFYKSTHVGILGNYKLHRKLEEILGF